MYGVGYKYSFGHGAEVNNSATGNSVVENIRFNVLEQGDEKPCDSDTPPQETLQCTLEA